MSITAAVQLATGVRIDDTKVAVDPETKQFVYEVHGKKNNAVVVFLTRDEGVYDEAARWEGTDQPVTLSYVRDRHNGKPALFVTDIHARRARRRRCQRDSRGGPWLRSAHRQPTSSARTASSRLWPPTSCKRSPIAIRRPG